MSKVASMAGKKAGHPGESKDSRGAGTKVVAHPKTKLRDIENLLRYVEWKDGRRSD
jgi:glycerol kinase